MIALVKLHSQTTERRSTLSIGPLAFKIPVGTVREFGIVAPCQACYVSLLSLDYLELTLLDVS